MARWEQETTYDLHYGRDHVSKYFRVLATFASWLILGGYIVFPLATGATDGDLSVNSTTLAAWAGTSLVVGYVLMVFTATVVRSTLFHFDLIYLPLLTSSALGLFAILLNFAVQERIKLAMPLIYLPISLASASTIMSAMLAFWAYWRISQIRASDNRKRISRDRKTWRSPTDEISTLSIIPHLPEDELQRQQLLRLLLKRDADRVPSPDSQSNTYHIDLPTSPNKARLFSLPGEGRSVSLGSERSGWQLKDIFPFRRASPSMESARSPRELRREEIENGTASPRKQFRQTLMCNLLLHRHQVAAMITLYDRLFPSSIS